MYKNLDGLKYDAPDWATDYGYIGVSKAWIFCNDTQYKYKEDDQVFQFDDVNILTQSKSDFTSVQKIPMESNMQEQQLIELWKTAPEGATHYNNFNNLFYKKTHKDYYCWKGSKLLSWNKSEFSVSETLHCLIPKRQEPSPVYTQEQCDALELPGIGLNCLVYDGNLQNENGANFSDWVQKEVLGHLNGMIICADYSKGVENVELYDQFKPLDTRTNKEKAVDDLAEWLRIDYQNYDNDSDFKNAESIIDLIIDGDLTSVTFGGNNE